MLVLHEWLARLACRLTRLASIPIGCVGTPKHICWENFICSCLPSSGDSGHPSTVPAGKDPIGKVSKIMASRPSAGADCERIRRMRRFEGRSRNPPTRTTVRPSAVVA